MSFKRVCIDLEANNLLQPMLDFSSMPYKLKEDSLLHCISLRDMDTKESVLLLPREHLSIEAPVRSVEYFYVINVTEVPTKLVSHIEHYKSSGELLSIDKTKHFNSLPDAELHRSDVKNKDGIKYNSLKKDLLTKDNLKRYLSNCTELVGHNIINYDLPVLMLFNVFDYKIGYPTQYNQTSKSSDNTITTVFNKPSKIIDTLILSKMYNPDLQDAFGRHALKAYGLRTGTLKGEYNDFEKYCWQMGLYCDGDTEVGDATFDYLAEQEDFETYALAYSMESKLADLHVRQETFGFYFDKDLAESCVEELTQLIQNCQDKVEPHLPQKALNKGEQAFYTPPKNQFKKNGDLAAAVDKFITKIDAQLISKPSPLDEDSIEYYIFFMGKEYKLPYQDPVLTSLPTSLKDGNVVKEYLIELGWSPSEWNIRDLTKDSKKAKCTHEKILANIERYVLETEEKGLFRKSRYEELDLDPDKDDLRSFLLNTYNKNPNKALKVSTTPPLRVGADKSLCPNLVKLSESMGEDSYIQFIVDFHTYKHRKNSIAGGDVDEEGNPTKGYLSFLREDGRIGTPADTLGAACVTANTLITTDSGLKPITAVSKGQHVLTHKGKYRKVTDKIINGIKNVYQVTLENGNSIECTENHRFWCNDGTWIQAQNLTVNDVVHSTEPTETWVEWDEYPNYYFSSWGRILTKAGIEVTKTLYLNSTHSRLTLHERGKIDLTNKDSKADKRRIGRFIYLAFNQDADRSKSVLHLDGNPTNNCLSNLVLGDDSTNHSHASLHGTLATAARLRKETILTEAKVKSIRKEYKEGGVTHQQLADKYNVTRRHMTDIINKVRWKPETNTDYSYTVPFEKIKVASVKYIGMQPTFDLTVDEHHSYVANNIVTHNTGRYLHRNICNVPRATSKYGGPMRAMFGCGPGLAQFGYDFSSLENLVQGHYVFNFEGGPELAKSLLAKKPNDSHCYSEDTQILTTEGWKYFNEVTTSTLVAQYEQGKIEFVCPTEVVWEKYNGDMIHILNNKTDMLLTPNHRVLTVDNRTGKEAINRADAFLTRTSQYTYPVQGLHDGVDIYSKEFYELLIATQADGCLAKDCNAITFSFTKQRKIDRLENLLTSLSATYTKYTHTRKNRVETTIRLPSKNPTTLRLRRMLNSNKQFIGNPFLTLKLSTKQHLVDSIGLWDGTIKKNGDIVLDTTDLDTVQKLQDLCVLSGHKTSIKQYTKTSNFGTCIIHRLYITTTKSNNSSFINCTSTVQYSGHIGCVSVPSGLIMVKRNEKVFISGNTLNGKKLGLSRSDAKSITYALLYGAAAPKIKKMLKISKEASEKLVDDFWNAVPPLKELRDRLTKYWKATGQDYIPGIDGRKLRVRKEHSLINTLFQSGGALLVKWSIVRTAQLLEEQGIYGDPFIHTTNDKVVFPMIVYHKLNCGL